VGALVGVCAVGASMAIAATSATAGTQATTRLSGSAVPATGDRLRGDAARASQSQTVEVWMAGHQQAAQRFIDSVSTPRSATYHRFLSPSAYTQRFGPSGAQVQAVKSYLTRAGFTHVHDSANDDYVSATASLSTIDRAFSVRMRRQRDGLMGASTTIESSDRDPTVPASLRSDVLSVTGVNTIQSGANDATTGAGGSTSTATAPTSGGAGAKAPVCSRYWAQRTMTVSPAFRGLTEVAIGVCGYSAKQVRAAYGLTSANTGRGKTIALIVTGAPADMFRTLTDYAKAEGLPAPRPARYRELNIGQGDACSKFADPEVQLDSEAAYAMAPGADQLMVDGDTCAFGKEGVQALLDAELAPLTGDGSSASAAIESCSFGIGTEGLPLSLRKASHAIALRAAAEGVSLLYASGDYPGLGLPASDPDVTAVGGTTLGVGAHNQSVFETGWSDGLGSQTGSGGPWQYKGIDLAAGGGASRVYGEPGYQKGVVPSSMARSHAGNPGRTVPDISADADPASGMLFEKIETDPRTGKTTLTSFIGDGTSQSTPLVAGMVADAEQGQRRNFGFLNPLLYSLAGSRAFHDILPVSSSDPQVDRAANTDDFYKYSLPPDTTNVSIFDDQDPSHTDQVTAPGYDTMTGLGTPNGSAFMKGLRSGG
jgi:subtilase family serine protease